MNMSMVSLFLLLVGCGVLTAALAAVVYVLLTQREK